MAADGQAGQHGVSQKTALGNERRCPPGQAWQVTVLVPESEIQQVHPGQALTVAVPAVGLSGIHGTIQQVSPTPVSTSIGTAYQAIVRITGHQRVTPPGGMTANVQLGS